MKVKKNPILNIINLPIEEFSIKRDAIKLEGISIPSNNTKSKKVSLFIFGAVAGSIKKIPLKIKPANDAIIQNDRLRPAV